ncbi:MAG: hypothetical protein IPK64_07910 [bacterium]|nr:hypothetical protein [bacterium]
MTDGVLLPDGRSLRLDATLAGRVRCGVLVARGPFGGNGEDLATLMARTADELRGRYAGAPPSTIEGLAEARALYRSFGMEPSRHRPSSEALLRRVLQGRDLYRLGCVVDACNLASLSFLLPIGLYDLACVQGDIALTVGAAGDAYAGIRKEDVNVGGRLALYDRAGPFGSPTSDSARTRVTDATADLLAVIMATGTLPAPQMEGRLDLLAGLLVRHSGAQVTWRRTLGPAEA